MHIDRSMVHEKGQIASIDVAVSMIVILALTATSLTYVYNGLEHSQNVHSQIEMDKEAYESTELLVTTPGMPINWHEPGKEIKRIGLSRYAQNTVQHHDLEKDKVERVKELSMKEVEQGLGVQNKVESLRITSIETGELKLNKERAPVETEETRKVSRIVLIGGEKCVLELGLMK